MENLESAARPSAYIGRLARINKNAAYRVGGFRPESQTGDIVRITAGIIRAGTGRRWFAIETLSGQPIRTGMFAGSEPLPRGYGIRGSQLTLLSDGTH